MRFLFLIALGVITTTADDSSVLKEFGVGNHRFSADVYKELLKTNRGNFLVCPLSAQIILALLHAGAEGRTAQELSNGLHLPESREKIQQIIQELAPYLRGNENYALNSANKIYVRDGLKIQDQYKNTAVNIFKSDIQNIDFEKKQQAADEINKWVEEHTDHKIKKLLEKEQLDGAISVLVNAMYFLGRWEKSFDASNTIKKPFFLNNNKEVEVEMMHNQGPFRYSESSELNAQFLQLAYIGGDITMTWVLPNDKKDFSKLESRINDLFDFPDYSIYYEQVVVEVPKFKIETRIEFTDILKALGIQKAFSDNAELDEILVGQPMKIDAVIQKTFIEVDERGTKAAAATGIIGVVPISLPPPPKIFIANHPFIFYIKIKDVVFFVGRYTSPTA